LVLRTWNYCFGCRFYCRSSKTRQLLLSAADQNTGYSENVVMLTRHAAQFNYFRWDKWDGPLKPEVDINWN
jgi:hypothetical protein